MIIVLSLIIVFIIIWLLFIRKVEYSVTIDYNGAPLDSVDIKLNEGKTVNDIEIPSIDGYNFSHWEIDGKKVDGNYKITKDIKLKAIWEDDKSNEQNDNSNTKNESNNVSNGK